MVADLKVLASRVRHRFGVAVVVEVVVVPSMALVPLVAPRNMLEMVALVVLAQQLVQPAPNREAAVVPPIMAQVLVLVRQGAVA